MKLKPISANLIFGFAVLSQLFASGLIAQEDKQFQITANSADIVTPIGGKGAIGFGFYAESMYPLSTAFQAQKTGSLTDMRFQVPVGFGLEGSYGFTRSLEVALSAGVDYFESQAFISSPSPGVKRYNIARFRMFPVSLIGRYRWPRKTWAPEVELGLGTAFGDIKVRDTQAGGSTLSKSGPFHRAHAAVGTGFSWAEGASLHFQIGYAMNMLGSKTYTDGSFTVEQKGSMSGIFTKAFLKFYF